MKKIIAAGLISIVLASCKKETKTITKIDPTTGDTIKMEVAVEDSAKIVKELAAKAAIKDSAGVYRQSFKLEKGKTYPFTTYQKNSITVSAPNGEKQTMSTENTDEVTFAVNEIVNGVYDITVNFVAKKSSQTAQGKTVSVDTKAAAPKDEQLKNKWTLDKALTGNKLAMKMDESGKIISITGFDQIYKKMESTIAGLTKDANMRKMLSQQAKAGFNEDMLKDQFQKNIIIFPKKGAKIGEKWTVTENATPDGKVKITTNYILKNVKDGVAEIGITGGIPYQSEKATQEGITRSMSSELAQNGTMKFDINSGWILNQNLSVKTTQKETLSDGKQTQSMTNVTNSSVIVNPVKTGISKK